MTSISAPISVYLVGQENVFKEGIKSLLAKNDFDLQQDCDSPASISANKNETGEPQLIVVIEEDGDDCLLTIKKIKSVYRQSRIVMIGGYTEAATIMSAGRADADGIILKDISCGLLISSLKLTAAGKKVYPTRAPIQPNGNGVAANTAANTNDGYNLSRQEMRIVHCLTNGEPNKVIAHHLNITEATVKVHVRTILRKLGTSNRTQAALLAVSRGLTSPPSLMQAQTGSIAGS